MQDRISHYTRDAIFRQLSELSYDDLCQVRTRTVLLAAKRSHELQEQRDKLVDGWAAFAVFLGNVVQAMSCRQLLRWSKGHPSLGKGTAAGDMWLMYEIIDASYNFRDQATVLTKVITQGDYHCYFDKDSYDTKPINPLYNTKLSELELRAFQNVIRLRTTANKGINI